MGICYHFVRSVSSAMQRMVLTLCSRLGPWGLNQGLPAVACVLVCQSKMVSPVTPPEEGEWVQTAATLGITSCTRCQLDGCSKQTPQMPRMTGHGCPETVGYSTSFSKSVRSLQRCWNKKHHLVGAPWSPIVLAATSWKGKRKLEDFRDKARNYVECS